MKKLAFFATVACTTILSAPTHASTYVMCHFNSFSATHSPSPMAVTSTHDVSITNTSNAKKSYHVEYRMFIEKKLIHVEALDVTINPGGTFTENKLETSPQTFKNPVKLSSSCETIVMGAEKADIKGGGSISIN